MLNRKVEIISEREGVCRLEDPFQGFPFEINGVQESALQRLGDELHIQMAPTQKVTLTRKAQ